MGSLAGNAFFSGATSSETIGAGARKIRIFRPKIVEMRSSRKPDAARKKRSGIVQTFALDMSKSVVFNWNLSVLFPVR